MDGMALNIIFASSAGLAGSALGFWLRGGKKGNPAREADLEKQLKESNAAAQQLRDELQASLELATVRSSRLADLDRDIKRLEEDAAQARTETRSVQTAMDQLQKLAANMAANVGEHNNQMQAINDELGEANSEADCVVPVVARLIEANAQMQEQLETADDALYVYKEAGRDCGHLHDGTDIRPITEAVASKAAESDEVANSRLGEWTGFQNRDFTSRSAP